MNIKCISKLKNYSLFSSIFILPSTELKSEIVYTDVDPDFSYTGDPAFLNYPIDMDNDGIADFTMIAENFFYITTTGSDAQFFNQVYLLYCFGGSTSAFSNLNSVLKTSIDGDIFPVQLVSGDVINEGAGIWSYSSNMLMKSEQHGPVAGSVTSYSAYGNWLDGATDKFLGIRFKIEDQLHYGWIRLDVDPINSSFTLKDFAYDSTVEETILAGENDIVENIDQNSISENIHIYTIGSNIIIQFDEAEITGASYFFSDISGKIIMSGSLNNKLTSLDVNNQSKGIYFITISINEISYTEKIYF